jgi:NAD(P)-dependent dehydrogenase (short-subunit alcohol dehydrogenase family)
MMRYLWGHFEDGNFAQLTGFGRIAEPEEIAAVVVFLCTDDASFITGQVIPVCGLWNLGTV